MLTDLPTVKAQLGIAANNTAQDVALNGWLAAADAAVKGYCHRDFEQQNYPASGPAGDGDSGYYSGNDSPYIILRQTPVTAIANLWQDSTGYFDENPSGSFASNTLLTYGTDYSLRFDGCLPGSTTKCSFSGIVQRIASTWPALRQSRLGRLLPVILPGNGNIKVQYTAGFVTIPGDLIVAVCQIVARMRATAKQGVPIQSEGLGAYNYTLAAAVLNHMPELGSTRMLLAKYRKVDL